MGQAVNETSVPESQKPAGLSSTEVAQRLAQYGPNVIAEDRPNPLKLFLKKLWGPVPWMLEATLVLELIMGNRIEGLIIGFLLVFNAILGFMHQQKAQNALNMLRTRLQIMARVRRDGVWKQVASAELVPGVRAAGSDRRRQERSMHRHCGRQDRWCPAHSAPARHRGPRPGSPDRNLRRCACCHHDL